jgi:hypothetical protein
MQSNYSPAQDIQAGVASGQAMDQSMNEGVKLAQAGQDMKQKQIQVAEMQDNLDMGRANSLVQRLTTQNKIGDPRLRQAYAKQNDQWAQKNGLAYQGFFNDHAGDDAQQRLGPLADILMGSVKTPDQARAALAAASDPAMLDQAVGQLQENKKQQNAVAIATAANASKLEVERMKQQSAMYGADKRLEGAQAMAGPRQDRIQLQGNRMYSQEMGPSENLLLQSNKLNHLVKDVESGDINSNKTIRGDIQSGIALLLNGGKPSTVFGQQAVEQDSAYGHIKDFQNKYLGEAESTIPPAQWEQLKRDIKALRNANEVLHKDKYESFREGLNGSAIQPHLDERYGKFRSNMNGESSAAEGASSAATAPALPSWASSYKDSKQQTFIQGALSHGYSQKDIEDYLKKGK